jgi:hypothetical protein
MIGTRWTNAVFVQKAMDGIDANVPVGPSCPFQASVMALDGVETHFHPGNGSLAPYRPYRSI